MRSRFVSASAVTVAGSLCSALWITRCSSPEWIQFRSTNVSVSKVIVRTAPFAPILIVSWSGVPPPATAIVDCGPMPMFGAISVTLAGRFAEP